MTDYEILSIVLKIALLVVGILDLSFNTKRK